MRRYIRSPLSVIDCKCKSSQLWLHQTNESFYLHVMDKPFGVAKIFEEQLAEVSDELWKLAVRGNIRLFTT